MDEPHVDQRVGQIEALRIATTLIKSDPFGNFYEEQKTNEKQPNWIQKE